MTLKKTLAIAAAAGALTAVALPAMAFDNEFHGMYRFRGIMSNFENAASGVLAKDPHTMTVFEQRARIMYTAKASDDLKLVTHFEIDSSWGDNGGATGGRGVGGGQGADSVNIETKNVYLDFKIPSTPVQAKVGIQGFSDAYKGIFVSDDLGGAVFTAKTGAMTTTAAFSRLQDGPSNANPVGQRIGDLWVLDGKYAISKDLNVGGSYYLYRNNMKAGANVNGEMLNIHMFGLNAAAKVSKVDLDAFVVMQAGDGTTTKKDLLAWAGQVGMKAAVGPGTLRSQFLYASGDSNTADNDDKAFVVPTGYVGSSSHFYSANMLLLLRSIYATDTDKAIVMTTNNANQGLIFGNVGYDTKFTDKLGASINVGFAADAQRNTVTASKSKFIGTEINGQLDYKMYNNLTTSFQVAYVILGDRYKKTAAGSDPENPYMTNVMLNYAF